jgi:hypothetical protein
LGLAERVELISIEDIFRARQHCREQTKHQGKLFLELFIVLKQNNLCGVEEAYRVD